jgi:NAD(P)-dependent dehydrogenase (short-subunit alcohol dehydrogenase family)
MTAGTSGRFRDLVCLVTGSGGAIGRETCLRLASEGAVVVGCDIAVEDAQETARLVTANGGAMRSVEPCDLTSTTECERLIETVGARHGRLDVLVNNGAMAHFAWIEQMSDDLWIRTMDSELNLVLRLTRAAWPLLSASGRGAIVNVASMAGWIAIKDAPGLAHSTAKGGVLAMTRHMAMEGAPHGLRANSVSPGTIESKQTRAFLADPASAAQVGRAMLGRAGQAHEVAAAIAFLAGPDASYITGTDLRVDGGVLAW